jgi:hypothetical protein
MTSVTIQHLEVRFHVEGNDVAEFTRLFELHIKAWSHAYEQEKARLCRSEAERGLGDRTASR